uniref:Uncharacterized protein n=1 Tax=Pongo abelii TaxID=9601 RepID=A0A8I5UIH7_PONAB
MCLAWGRTVTVALLVGFVSPRCFLESRRFYLLAPFPATLCPLEARRHQRLQFCYSLLGMERSGKIYSWGRDVIVLMLRQLLKKHLNRHITFTLGCGMC